MRFVRTIPIVLALVRLSSVNGQTLGESPSQNRAIPIPQSVPETGDLTPTELQLVQDATEDARRIVQAAALAKVRSADEKIASYAARVVQKDTSFIRSMEDIGRLNGLTMEVREQDPSSEPSSLASLEGPEFDRTFLQNAITNHQNLVSKLEAATHAISNEDLHKRVSKSVSTLKDLNKDAQKLAK